MEMTKDQARNLLDIVAMGQGRGVRQAAITDALILTGDLSGWHSEDVIDEPEQTWIAPDSWPRMPARQAHAGPFDALLGVA